MRFVELFAGIGGFSLGFERAGMECVGHVEIDPYAQKVLKKHWDQVPLFPDVTKIKGDEFGRVDLLCGGFPCQDISTAGKQRGIHADRSSLFDEIIRIAGVCRPKYIVLENVANLISRSEWIGYVLGRISEIGYDAEWEIIQANWLGFPHKRRRIFIVAYPSMRRSQKLSSKHGEIKKIFEEMSSNTFAAYLSAKRIYGLPDIGINRGVTRVSHRVDRLKCLGNALIPQIAELIGKRIMEVEEN